MLNPKSATFNGLFWVGSIAWVLFFLLYSEDIHPAFDIVVTNEHALIASIWFLVLLFLSGWAWGYDKGYSEGFGKSKSNEKPPPPDWFENY